MQNLRVCLPVIVTDPFHGAKQPAFEILIKFLQVREGDV